MAAATIAAGPTRNVVGNKRHVYAQLTAPANNSTFDTGLTAVEAVFVTFNSTSTVAADSYAATVSGATVTLTLAGTARDIYILAIGY